SVSGGPDGSFFVAMDDEDLMALQKTCQRALSKAKTLENFSDEKNFILLRTTSDEEEQTESSN
ncbi:MAG: hypothetical protein WBD74_09690, partial [Candidatus Aquilonibacter sp.]